MTKLDVELSLLRENFIFFVCFCFKTFYEKEFTFHWFHKDFAQKLTTLEPHARKVVNAPPRIGKTVLIQMFVAWLILRNPKATIIYICYEERLAAAKNREIKDLCVWLAKRYGLTELLLNPQAQGKTHWINRAGGGVMARGSKNGITGFGADTLLIVDDPNKPEDRSSPATLDMRNRAFSNTIRNRINTPDVPIVVVQQRVASNDLSGYLLNYGSEKWEHYNYPALNEDGTALCPERLPVSEVETYKSDPFTYNAQYLQVPLDDIGKLFDKNKLVLATSRPNAAALRLVISVDAAGKGDIGNDFNAIAVIGTDGRDFYILEILNFHADITVLLQKVRELRQRFGQKVPVVFESRANGQAAVQLLRKETSGILEVNPIKDKVERAILVKYLFDSMNVMFCLRGLVWGEVQAQFTQFPHCKHDDIVDAVVQGITWLQSLPKNCFKTNEERKPKVNLGRPCYGQRSRYASSGYYPSRGS